MKVKDKRGNNENPFYGKKAMLTMLTQLHKLEAPIVNVSMLNKVLTDAWLECTNEQEKGLFFSIIFASADITNRNHNVLKRNKVKNENGGNSTRKVFYHSSVWALTYNKETESLWYSLIDLIPEYTNFENIMLNGIKTDRKTGAVLATYKLPIKLKLVAKYLAKVISDPKTGDHTHRILSKWLDVPRYSKRNKLVKVNAKNIKKLSAVTDRTNLEIGEILKFKRNITDATKSTMDFKANLANELSLLMNWEMIKYPSNIKYVGLQKYISDWNKTSEAYLFSTSKILEMDEVQFVEWLDRLSAGSRFRVRNHLFNKGVSNKKWTGKFGDLATFYTNWENSKLVAQEKLRNLSDEDKSTMTKKDLVKMTKDAKVNTGATTLPSLFVDLLKSNNSKSIKDFDIQAESIMSQIKLEVPVLVINDVSGSMSSTVPFEGVNVPAINLAKLFTTIFLMKNPDESLNNLFLKFSDRCTTVTDGSIGMNKTNRFTTGTEVKTTKLIDKKEAFSTNLERISKHLYTEGGTNPTTISKGLRDWAFEDSASKNARIEEINKYPVFLILSDGDFNNSYNAASSIALFKQDMLQYFGWEGVVVIWDLKSYETKNKFEGLENVIYYGGINPGILNSVFTKIHDLDIIDVYTPLLTLSRSERYSLVNDRVVKFLNIKKDKKEKELM